jgi:subtilisin-like proprotein convertase family protein
VSVLSRVPVVGAPYVVLLLFVLLAMPAAAPAAGDPHGHEEPLPDLDSRTEAKPTEKEARARARLADSLGPMGFADTGGALSGPSFIGRSDGYLTGPSDASAKDVALDYVRGNRAAIGLGSADIDALELGDAYTSQPDGVRHLTFEQIVDGVPSFDTQLIANVSSEGHLINLSGSPEGGLELDDPEADLSAKDALLLARENVEGHDQPWFGPLESARLVAFAKPGAAAELAWDVYVESADSLLYEVVVGADSGEVLLRGSRTDFANQADIWPNHPAVGVPPTRVNLGADPTWIDDAAGGTRLAGNNAHAYADINNNGIADAGENVAQVGGDWLFPMTFFNHAGCPAFGCTWQNSNPATRATNQNQAVTGLFYLNNRFHDHLLAPPIGFNEASRNFERVNSTGLGIGNDAVRAEGNDGGGTNNANFNTPPDGSPPRMQQYFFNLSWDVNSTDTADIVYHEYTHGLTNRLVGNGGGGLGAIQSGAMGEGWSDWYANDFLVGSGQKSDGPGPDLMMGEYAIDLFGVGGIRRQRMDCKPTSPATFCPAYGTTGTGGFTFGDLGKFAGANGVHDNGEIWSQTLWDLRERIGANSARAVVTGGLRLSPLNPSFLQMRDAILQSAKTLGIARRPIWQTFAARGMGFSASTPAATSLTAIEAFDVPAPLAEVARTYNDSAPLGDGDGVLEPKETLRITSELTNPVDEAISNVKGTLSSPDAGVLLGGRTSSWPNFPAVATNATNHPAFSLTLQAGATCGQEVEIEIDLATSAGPISLPPASIPVGAPSFQTANPAVAIPDNNATGVTATMELPAGTVQDVDVRIDSVTHTWLGDLRFRLTSPTATSVLLVDRLGGGANSADNISNLTFDDEAALPISSVGTSSPATGPFRPAEPLSALDGEASGGTWSLTVSDLASSDVGTLNSWSTSTQPVCSTSVGELPQAITDPATNVGVSSATLNGKVDPNGAATNWAVEYGKTTAYGSRTPVQSAGGGLSPVSKSAVLNSLDDNATYHYRMLALRDGTVIAHGQNRSFSTLEADTTPPQTTLTKKPKKKNKSKKKKKQVTFEFVSDEPGTFSCSLNGAAFKSCSSPFKKKLRKGKHTFAVRATDEAGNTDPTPAEHAFKIKKKKK